MELGDDKAGVVNLHFCPFAGVDRCFDRRQGSGRQSGYMGLLRSLQDMYRLVQGLHRTGTPYCLPDGMQQKPECLSSRSYQTISG